MKSHDWIRVGGSNTWNCTGCGNRVYSVWDPVPDVEGVRVKYSDSPTSEIEYGLPVDCDEAIAKRVHDE